MKKNKLLFAVMIVAIFVFGTATFLGCEVRNFNSISVSNNPNKMIYSVGQTFNPAGGKIKLEHPDPQDDYEIGMDETGVTFDYNFASTGTKTVTIKYKGLKVTLDVNVVQSNLLTGIIVSQEPNRMIYEVGETFDSDGGKIMLKHANPEDNYEINMNDAGVTIDHNFSSIGTKLVTITYRDFKAELDVVVTPIGDPILVSIAVSKAPTKVEYEANETFVPAGGKLKRTYNRGAPNEIDLGANGVTFEYDFSKKGNATPVKVKYGGKQTALIVKVNPPPVPIGYGDNKKKAPDFTAYTLAGEEVKLSDYYSDKPVLITMWATWCGPCIKEMPYFSAVYKEMSDKFEILAVSDEEFSKIKAFSDKNASALSFRLLQDKNLNIIRNPNWYTGGLPSNYVVDKWGYLVCAREAYANIEGIEVIPMLTNENAVYDFNLSSFANQASVKYVIENAIARADNYRL